ncbi:MAG: hypothetical protein WBS20_10045 [Lysobacterales bacterium]
MQAKSSAPAKPFGKGFFKGVVGERAYLVNVECSNLEQDYFSFKSDPSDVNDTNGDGLIISGMQNGEKFVLTIVDNGETFSVGRLANFNKTPDGAEGSGTLFQDNSTASFASHFSVKCR